MTPGPRRAQLVCAPDVLGDLTHHAGAESVPLACRLDGDGLDVPCPDRGVADVDVALHDRGVGDDRVSDVEDEMDTTERVEPVILGECLLAGRKRCPQQRSERRDIGTTTARRRRPPDPSRRGSLIREAARPRCARPRSAPGSTGDGEPGSTGAPRPSCRADRPSARGPAG